MRVLISGGTGMIGSSLAKSLLRDGHQVWILTRAPHNRVIPQAAQTVTWDGRTSGPWTDVVCQVDAVVNLVGERLSKWPWTKAQMQRFWNSRVDGGYAITEAIRVAAPRPKVLIQASGVNYYGPSGLEPISESHGPGNDFLSKLCLAWEASTFPVDKLGVRRAVIRSGIVLSAQDGILPIMMLPMNAFVGGRLGSGSQGLAFIHLEDEVTAIRFLLENQAASGAFNLTSPQLVSSGEFLHVLAHTLHRPYWFPVPQFILRLMLGGMATLVVDGAYVLPQRLLDLGFGFAYPGAESALTDLLGR